MAIKGLSIPVCGEYAYSTTTGEATYSDGFVASKAVEYGITIEVGDDNPDYQDNGVAENDKGTFAGGELSLTTGDLPQDLSKKLLGTKTVTESLGSDSVTVQVYDDDAVAPYLGFGIIEMHQIDDATRYRAVFLNKVYFNIPEEAATTKGESIEWQHPQITGRIMRSDVVNSSVKHPWKEDAWFTTESAALNWLKSKVGITTAGGNEEEPPIV